MKAMIEAKMSEKEVAYRFGKSKDRIRDMLQGKVKADKYLIDAIKGAKRG